MKHQKRFLKNPLSNKRGFTLIEILLVVIIIGILVSLVAPRLAGRSEEARKQAAKADIDGGVSLALDLYEVDNGRYPTKLDDLIQKSSDAPNWKGPYLKKGLPKDPWGSPYNYSFPGSHNTTSYDLFSAGPDKQEGTDDDVVNWKTESTVTS
jgi:general secretion pathway protein G